VKQVGEWTARSSGARMLGALGFENAYAFAMRGQDARRRGIRTLDDLAAQAPRLTLGSDLEFLERPEWMAVRDAYGIHFGATQRYTPSFMYRAIASRRADVISAFSSDGRIAKENLAVLDDTRGAIPGYDAIVLVTRDHATDPRLISAIAPLVGHISVEAMRQANYMVDRDGDKASPDQAARWLEKKIGVVASMSETSSGNVARRLRRPPMK
jgi:osmoprotectant transport system permease protein